MHVILVGGGEIGFALAQNLAREHEVFVIDQSPAVAERFQPLDVQFLLGTGTSADMLDKAGIERADVLVACTGLDEVNIVSCAIGRQRGRPRTVCVVSRQDFLELQNQAGLAQFGVDRLVWPEEQLAADIERIVRAPDALDAETFANGAIRLLEYRLEAQSAATGKRVMDLHLPHGSLIVAVRRGDSLFIPRGDSQLAVGDRTVVMGTPEALVQARARLTEAARDARQRVTIIGGGDVGLHLAARLEEGGEMDVTIVERSPERGEMLAARLRRTLVLNGDGTDLELLEAEDVGRSDVLVCVIDNDERNLFASLLGRQLGARRIIARVSKRRNLRLFERVGVDVAITARGAAVASVLNHIQGETARLLAVVEQGAGRIQEIDVPAGYAPRTLREMAPPRDGIVGAILREGGAIVPRGDDAVRPGDRLMVFSTEAAAGHVRDFFRSGRA